MEACAIIDPRLPGECEKNLRISGFLTITAPLTELVDKPLSGHPDIQMFHHGKNMFVHPDIDLSFLKKIERYVNIIQCKSKLEKKYPGDIHYNIACTGTAALHRKESTDKSIINYFSQNKIEVIDVKQGYSKCSTLIADERSIITSDKSIKSAADNAGFDTLLITPGFIDLPGYNHGFIGGASGKFLDTVYLTGSIDHHPDKAEIEQFISSKGLNLKILSNKKIFDSGSIFFIS
jgi:hypothetical protein